MSNQSRILLVDDEKRMCDSLRTLLEIEGYQVDALTDAEMAVDLLRSRPYDLVITDIRMPHLSGLDILKHAQQIDPHLEVILMTGYASLTSAKEAVDLGAFGYLTKPIELEELKVAIARSLDKRQIALEKESLLLQLKQANEQLERNLSEIDALYSAGTILATTIDLTEALTQIISLAIDVIGAKIGSVMILDPRKNELYIGAACGLATDIVANTSLKVGDSVAGYVALTGEPLMIQDIEKDPRFSRINRQHYESKSLLSVPLKYKGAVLGVINLNNKMASTAFDEHDLKLLNTFAAQAAIAIDRANIFADKGEKINELTILFEIARQISIIDNISKVGEIILTELGKLVSIEAVIWYSTADKGTALNMEFLHKAESFLTKAGANPPASLKVGKDDTGRDKEVDIEYVRNELLGWLGESCPATDMALELIPVRLHKLTSGIMALVTRGQLTAQALHLATVVAFQAVSVYERQKAVLTGAKLVTMGKMVSEICHDLKKPLTNLKGNVQVYKDRIPGREATEFFTSSEKELNRLKELVDELGNFANPNMYCTSRENLGEVVAKAAELLERDLQKKQIELVINQAETVPRIEINRNEILAAILNVMLNSIESMEDGGRLEVVIAPDPAGTPFVRISVIDTGHGIPESELPKVFDRYYTTRETGTGLGLAIVERVVEAHNGRVKVESRLGQGTAVTIDLPV